ncbi:MAG: MarR family transcriptional regulator [Actinobacteria bacterium]|nr:MAG: MarR family transcriptional regulator [Actinomycetota bacterium]
MPPPTKTAQARAGEDSALATRENVGFLLAKASQRWNELLGERFAAHGYAEIRPAYGSILVPLFEEDGLRLGELGHRARLAKQTMTTMVRLLERDALVERERDPADGRASLVRLTPRAKRFRPVAEEVLRELDDQLGTRIDANQRATLEAALKEVIDL